MKKVILTAMLALAVVAGANAQIKLGANFGVQMPMGDYGDFMKTGFGGNISGEYLVTENIGVGLGLGYYGFAYKGGGDESATIIPITLNGTYYFMTEGIKPYAGIDLGAYMLGSTASGSDTETKFGFAPVVGLQYDITDSFALNANLKYNYIMSGEDGADDFTSFGINVGVVYSLGK